MQDLKETARNIRKQVLKMIYNTQGPHIGSCFSCVDILVALYFNILLVSPETKKDKNRDIFILSKGHAAPALYAVLAERGYFEKEKLEKFAVNGGLLEGHPSKDSDLGIEVTTGSLGHGLCVGAGMALARKIDNSKSRVFVLMSDGDLQEGSTWQALMFASQHNLNNLIAIIDYNKIQVLGKIKDIMNLEPLEKKLSSFGWQTIEIDGNNIDEIINAFSIKERALPTVVICHTKKGKGVSFMEDNPIWHSKCPSEEEYKKALNEL